MDESLSNILSEWVRNSKGRCTTRRAMRSRLSWSAAIMVVLALLLCQFGVVVADWIDPDTPWEALTTYSYAPHAYVPGVQEKRKKDNRTISPAPTESPTSSPTFSPTATQHAFELVFSDEFNTPGRTFEDGSDPRWTAIHKNDYTNDALHYYSNQNARTNERGELEIISEAADTDVVGFNDVKRKNTHVTKHFRSAMLQSWNKFCFTGGIIEAEVVLPGKHNVGGLWPAFWILGNLARHTYVGSSQHVWPWSATKCTQKSADSQLLNACTRIMHYGLKVGVGRGAPEIDIFEVQPGNIRANTGVFLESSVGQPFMSSSFQVAPGRPVNRPGPGFWPGPGQWYEGLKGGNKTALNILFYGNYNHFRGDYDPARQDYWSDAISYNRQLNESHFKKPHVYRLEWDVPTNGTGGYLHWFVDGELVVSMDGKKLHNSSAGAEISSEPSSIILNTAISSQWGFPNKCPVNCPCKVFDCHAHEWKQTCGFSEGFCDMMKKDPPKYRINWIRVYQDPNDEKHKVGCSTPERPTRKYIEAHEKLYKQEGDLVPLRGIPRGRGTCVPGAVGVTRDSCGGIFRGRCTQGRVCECADGWIGPHCLAHDGWDPILYDAPDKITDIGFVLPGVVPLALLVVLGIMLVFVMLMVVMPFLKRRMDQWTPIPDAVDESVDESFDELFYSS